MSAASRLSYSMAKTRFLPPVFSAIDRRGVPWFSIIFGGVFGCILFLPFGSWAALVAAITAASSFMYSFAPVAAVSLRKSDPDRQRPYRAPILNIIAPFSFVVSGFIIYWSGTANVIKLDIAVVFFLILYLIARRIDPNQEPLDFRAGSFAIPWIIGLTIFSIFGGSYVGGISNAATGGYDTFFGIHIGVHLPFWWDLGAIAVFALIVFYFGVNSRLGPERVKRTPWRPPRTPTRRTWTWASATPPDAGSQSRRAPRGPPLLCGQLSKCYPAGLCGQGYPGRNTHLVAR